MSDLTLTEMHTLTKTFRYKVHKKTTSSAETISQPLWSLHSLNSIENTGFLQKEKTPIVITVVSRSVLNYGAANGT